MNVEIAYQFRGLRCRYYAAPQQDSQRRPFRVPAAGCALVHGVGRRELQRRRQCVRVFVVSS
ncbi:MULTISPECIES: hypothetical protein [unclassified Gordonia (in: high G+C Gram-positive bacteria)]|uniref:hypothetical protein n=1 Tax=unclassified Gordonia (in: high G+C Gram-positive bacteria) TaxID=2657482 RepID=UPI0018D3545A|nr:MULTISPECIES: hypothetical protein [unclassified Gordonia (in: high G+C Gram-positive bacteria)]